MVIVRAYPPIYDRIAAMFPHIRGREVYFCWGNKIYCPNIQGEVPPEIVEHERVHFRQQTSAPELINQWWNRYLVDPAFRLEQEIPAHFAEYRCLIEARVNRSDRRRILVTIAKKLSSPFYGGLISSDEAKRILQNGHR